MALARFMASLRRLFRTVTSLTQDTPPKVREISDGTPDLLVGTELAGVFVHSPTLRWCCPCAEGYAGESSWESRSKRSSMAVQAGDTLVLLIVAFGLSITSLGGDEADGLRLTRHEQSLRRRNQSGLPRCATYFALAGALVQHSPFERSLLTCATA